MSRFTGKQGKCRAARRSCPGGSCGPGDNLMPYPTILGFLDRVVEYNGPVPTIVCLCGSTRFKDAINKVNAELTLKGELVISLGVFGHTDMPDCDWTTGGSDLKRQLDELHKRKIDLADYVYVVNVGGYIGESTKSEVAYAMAHGKEVRWLEWPSDPAELEDLT